MITHIYKKDEIIFKRGEPAKTLIVLKKGNAAAIEELDEVEKESKIFKPGDYFGESGFFENSVRAVTVKAIWPLVICLAISRKTMIKILGDKLEVIKFLKYWQAILIKNELEKIINKDMILKKLP